MNDRSREILQLTTEVVASFSRSNALPPADLPGLIAQVHGAILQARQGAASSRGPRPEPAVSIRHSVMPDYIVCLEDGKRLKSLKRHLSSRYGMTPDDYRKRWGLPQSYPMVAPSYTAVRSELAKRAGLGRHRR